MFCGGTAHAAEQRPNILFCVADDWGWPHAGVYGDKVVKTPNFDRVAKEGVLFNRAYSAAPSCTPSRAAMLTGRAVHQLREGGNLWGFLPKEFEVYPNLLEKSGYVVGLNGKGWGPGNFKAGGRERNPAGPQFNSFAEFLNTVPSGKPFCFWFGSKNPHRSYEKGSGKLAGMKPEDVQVPAFWPDNQEVREDILDYYDEVQKFDAEVGALLALLEKKGMASNTVVVITADNGRPFPRAKANLYDAGTHQTLAVKWPGAVTAGRSVDEFVNLQDIAPTFLEIAGLKARKEMVGRSFVPLLKGKKQGDRDAVFVERERHANARKGDLSYPSRAVRTKDFLYIRNLRPDRWPAGDPEFYKAMAEFGDCDNSPTKSVILADQKSKFFTLGFGKRPAEELYDLRKDPEELNNVAGQSEYKKAQMEMRTKLDKWMKETKDPRVVNPQDDLFDTYPYFGSTKRVP